jgi:uncharacterized protein YjbJ (UPF0337 family)
MNRHRLEGNWNQFSGTVKGQWGRLTDDQSAVNAGKRTQRAGRIQRQYGVAKDQAEDQLKDLLGRNRD